MFNSNVCFQRSQEYTKYYMVVVMVLAFLFFSHCNIMPAAVLIDGAYLLSDFVVYTPKMPIMRLVWRIWHADLL